MGAACSVCGSNPKRAATLEDADDAAPADDDDANASCDGLLSDLAGALQGMTLALNPGENTRNRFRIAYDTEKYFWGDDNIPHLRQVRYTTHCPKGHPLVSADSRPKIAVLSSKGMSSPITEQLDPLQLIMPSNNSALKCVGAGADNAEMNITGWSTSENQLHCHVCFASAASSDDLGWFTCSVNNCCNSYAVCVLCMDVLNENAADDAESESGKVSPHPGMPVSVESSKSGFVFDKKVRQTA
jgi:hypothetical protein